MGRERHFAWDDGCTVECADDISFSCTLETIYGFVNQCCPNKKELKNV